jgi:FixJ family two-component response regulator
MNKRILIVDDEEHIRRVLRLTLETAGYEVGEAADGEATLAAFGDGSAWDAVLLDQKMPGMDGLDVLRQLKERRPASRVIMITAFASIELAVDAMKLGATDFVRKPMTPEIVRHALEAALAKSASTASHQVVSAGLERPARPLIETVTMNGFHILRPSDVGDDTPDAPNERRFVVKSPGGGEYKVTVEIDEESVGYVERMTRRKLPPENSFWTQRAQSTLAAYLWNEGCPPPDGKLTVTPVDRDELQIAERWSSE